ncbi:hypothetical protein GSI_14660 [Ganoderma sinense ZZ0214-1]|uniref:Major facilitator superfamily (MFS) profile domain-containing protein n=1 Tax=Ganoderma sinense ZZ0214-1 TaxID=1077348 RepID=A0A2G8RPB2_9APHY|nr:hypothetical protein GSI_14660 [Ganoderma sinense ZZ0214-1]
MISSTSFTIDQEVTLAPISPTREKHDVSIDPSTKDPGEIPVDTLKVIATQGDETEAKALISIKAMRRKASIQFAVLCMGNFVCGWNAGVVGPLGPRFLEAYHVGYSLLSISFSMMAVGRVFGATTFEYLVDRIGFGAISVTASILVAIGCALQASGVPFPVFVAASFLIGAGNAFLDVGSKAFVASQAGDSTAKMMILSAANGFGATCAPLAATRFALLARWSLVYTISIAFAVITGISQAITFRFRSQGECLKEIGQRPLEIPGDSLKGVSKYKQILHVPAIHLMAFFMFAYSGAQGIIDAWIITFLVEERQGGPNTGYVSTGMYAACAIGPLVMIPLSRKLGGWRAVLLYALLALALELVVWLVPSLIADGVAVSLVQFFLGTILPLVANHVRPVIVAPELFSGAISWISAIAPMGSTVAVFVSGVIASRTGINNLNPLVIALMGLMLVTWVFVPKHRAPPT